MSVNKIIWVLLSICFLIYGLYDLYEGIIEIKEADLNGFRIITKILVPSYIIIGSIYIIYLRTAKVT